MYTVSISTMRVSRSCDYKTYVSAYTAYADMKARFSKINFPSEGVIELRKDGETLARHYFKEY